MAVVKDCTPQQQHLLMMEVKVLSARSLQRPSSLLSSRLRPYVALSVTATSAGTWELDEPPPFPSASKGSGALYRTRVDEHGAENPTWGDTICLPLDPSFLHPAPGSATPAVHLHVLSQRRLAGPARVGWCRIPACDVVDGLRPLCSVRRLSYALRNCHHGGRGQGVVDVAVRLVGPAASSVAPPANAPSMVRLRELPRVQVLRLPPAPAPGWAGEVAIGMPVQAFGLTHRGWQMGGSSEETREEIGGLTSALTLEGARPDK